MQTFSLEEMKKGWFVGNFSPTCWKVDAFEVACQRYTAGTCEAPHVHRIATEVTLVVSGIVRMNGQDFQAGTIFLIEPGEMADFCALTDTVTVVVKAPSLPGDKYVTLRGGEER